MQINKYLNIASRYLSISLAVSYLWFVADRLGLIGKNGTAHVSWGDWQHFIIYARQTMHFLPHAYVPFFAVVATLCEATIGILLLLGLFTHTASIGSGILSLLFALSMALSFGIESPIAYSVFTVSAASFVLACLPVNKYSLDLWRLKNI